MSCLLTRPDFSSVYLLPGRAYGMTLAVSGIMNRDLDSLPEHPSFAGPGNVAYSSSMANEALREYRGLPDRNPPTVARFLARRGADFDRGLASLIEQSRGAIGDACPPLVCDLVESLIWSRHAKRSGAFLLEASEWIRSGNREGLEKAVGEHERFGPAHLKRSLIGLEEYFRFLDIAALPASLPDLIRFQRDLPTRVTAAKRQGGLEGLGAWLCFAPFKIHLTSHPGLLFDPGSDGVLMPLGTQVVAALQILARDGVIPRDVVPKPTENSSPADAFLQGVADIQICQQEQKRLADLASSRVAHINSALYELGSWNT